MKVEQISMSSQFLKDFQISDNLAIIQKILRSEKVLENFQLLSFLSHKNFAQWNNCWNWKETSSAENIDCGKAQKNYCNGI